MTTKEDHVTGQVTDEQLAQIEADMTIRERISGRQSFAENLAVIHGERSGTSIGDADRRLLAAVPLLVRALRDERDEIAAAYATDRLPAAQLALAMLKAFRSAENYVESVVHMLPDDEVVTVTVRREGKPTPQDRCEAAEAERDSLRAEMDELRANRDALATARRGLSDRVEVAEARLTLARNALIATGYFTAADVGDDIAPRITELFAALAAPTGQEAD